MSRILICYDHFFPAQRAGGIVQSIHNIVSLLHNEHEFYIITSNLEYGTEQVLGEIVFDKWLDYNGFAKLRYVSKAQLTVANYNSWISETRAELIYLNGLFSFSFLIKPLWALRQSKANVMLAPRGMLHQGALALKPIKKKVYFTLFKLIFPIQNFIWHATDGIEYNDIKKFVANSSVKIRLAGVLPELPTTSNNVNKYHTVTSELKLVYLSLVAQKKNLLLLLKALAQLDSPSRKISLTIFGPIKDQVYWEDCQQTIDLMPNYVTVNYEGALPPNRVSQTLRDYHLFVLPTAGENFGHAIFEALANATPVFISDQTPFTSVANNNAGFVVKTEVEAIKNALVNLFQLTPSQWMFMSDNAREHALNFYKEQQYEYAYRKLFELAY